MSTAEDPLDVLVRQASAPTLASLFKKAKESGLITAITGYGPNKEKKADPGNQSGQPSSGTYAASQLNAKFNTTTGAHTVPVNPNLS